MAKTNTIATETDLQRLTDAWAAAELRSDASALRSILADDFVCVGPLGFVLDREQYLEARRVGDLRHQSFAWESLSIRPYDGVAVVVGTQTQASTYQGRDASGRFRVTQVARRVAGEWRIVSLHFSRIAPPPGRLGS